LAERAPTRGEVEELARLLWEAFRGRPITLDARGRPNYFAVRAFARRLLELAYEHGIEDPLHDIDWVAVLDPDISREENLRRLEDYLSSLARQRESPADEVAEAISELERYLDYLRSELERAPEEARPSIEEEIRRVEQQLEELRRARRPAERRRRPPRRAPPRPGRPRIEEVLRELEDAFTHAFREEFRRRVGREPTGEEVRRALEAARPELERLASDVAEERRPLWLAVMDAARLGTDAAEKLAAGAAPPPPPPPPPRPPPAPPAGPPPAISPELERYLLWTKFSAALLAAGISPEEHRREFEMVLEATEGLPFEERQRRIEELARRIIETFRPPPPPPPPPVAREEIERIVREAVREAMAELLPPAPPALPEPEFVPGNCIFCGGVPALQAREAGVGGSRPHGAGLEGPEAPGGSDALGLAPARSRGV